MFNFISHAVIAFSLAVGSLFTPNIDEIQQPQIVEEKPADNLGAYNPSGGGTYRLKTSIGTTNTTITLSEFKEPVSGIPYTMAYLNTSVAYGTLDPQNLTRSEFISFTGITQNADGSAILTGVSRGMARSYPYTASTTLRQAHAGQSIFILSDSPQHFSEYAIKQNDETITGQWTFTNFPITASTSFATESVVGSVELSTGQEAASSTASGGTGYRLALPTSISTSTGGTAYTIPVTGSTGTLDDAFLSSNAQIKYINATSGEAISGATLPVPVYASTTDGLYYKSDANVDSKNRVIGFAISNTSGAGQVIKIQTGGVVTGFTGLSLGRQYYLSDTVGTIATSTGTYTIMVGNAVSTTTLLIKMKPAIVISGVGTSDTGNIGAYVDTAITLGFRPVRVTLIGYDSPATTGSGVSITYFINGSNAGYGNGAYSGTVLSVTDTGFTLRATQGFNVPATGGVSYTAESE